MGTNSAPPIADLILYTPEAAFIDSPAADEARKYRFMQRYLDDLLTWDTKPPPAEVYELEYSETTHADGKPLCLWMYITNQAGGSSMSFVFFMRFLIHHFDNAAKALHAANTSNTDNSLDIIANNQRRVDRIKQLAYEAATDAASRAPTYVIVASNAVADAQRYLEYNFSNAPSRSSSCPPSPDEVNALENLASVKQAYETAKRYTETRNTAIQSADWSYIRGSSFTYFTCKFTSF